MADSTIGNLPAASEITSQDLFVLEQNGQAKKLLGSILTEFISRNILDVSVLSVSATDDPTVSFDSETGVLQLGIPRGSGIANIEKDSTVGLTDIYAIELDQLPSQSTPTTFYFSVNNAKSIINIQTLDGTHTPGGLDRYSINFNDGTSFTFNVYNGSNGINGVSIREISKISGTGAAGTSDRYSVILSNGQSAGTFYVYNGSDGQGAPGSFTPLMDGEATVGTAMAYAREDHVHPTDISRQSANIYLTDVTVNNFTQESTPTYDGFEYRGTISNENITTDMLAEIILNPDDALNGDYAPVCETFNGGIYVYSKVNDSITIPTVIVFTNGDAYSPTPTPIPGDVATRTDIDNELYS